jgi:superfamily II DNA or RNA helicase
MPPGVSRVAPRGITSSKQLVVENASVRTGEPSNTMIVLHAVWSEGFLRVWGEDASLVNHGAGRPPVDAGPVRAHPFAADAERLAAYLTPLTTLAAEHLEQDAPAPDSDEDSDESDSEISAGSATTAATPATTADPALLMIPRTGSCVLCLPTAIDRPFPSKRLSHLVPAKGEFDSPESVPTAGVFTVPTFEIPPLLCAGVLEMLIDQADENESERAADAAVESGEIPAAPAAALTAGNVLIDSTIRFYAAASRFARALLAQQRFVPMLRQISGGELRGSWQPWPTDDVQSLRVDQLLKGMPPAARAAVNALDHQPWPVLDDFLTALVDAHCRRILLRENMGEVLEDREPAGDSHIAWLGGLLTTENRVQGLPAQRQEMFRRVRGWVSGLDDRGQSAAWRLCVRLSEPIDPALATGIDDGKDAEWLLSLHLQAVDNPAVILDAEDVWLLPGDSVTLDGRRLDSPREFLLTELARAAKIYPLLEQLLNETEPAKRELSTRQAYQFLREFRVLLHEQGFGAQAPEWWDSPAARLGARLKLDSDAAMPQITPGIAPTSVGGAKIGLGALVKYRWEIAVGDLTLTLQEFETIAKQRSPLVRVNGRWVEIRPEDVQAAIKFIQQSPGGEVRLGEAMKMAFGLDQKAMGIPVLGIEATGWVQAFLNSEVASKHLQIIEPPKTFHGTLRPYQVRGVSWLAFQEGLGFGACLADDMGLGKTIQLLALMALERENAKNQDPPVIIDPTLLIVPMSVVGNWMYESKRFCPELRVVIHHGTERSIGERLIERASNADLVITTYALAHRDREHLEKIRWGRLVLDEAQYIKNPATKQSQAVRSFNSERRVALTGTPVENRLSELWSIMDFLNPGYLGTGAGFRTRFSVPIERYHDKPKAEQLRGLIRPFILRRLKTDPNVVADLPEKVETKEYSHLTGEQAALYESCVRRMLSDVEDAEGIHRRGLVLAALIKLKQICNHPAQLLHEEVEGPNDGPSSPIPAVDPSRSGKCIRLLEMLDEVLAEGDQALIFTQFRQMGHILWAMLRRRFDKDILFLHGGTTQPQRQAIIERFQKADGTSPLLLLSLKAGGVGLNLTAANHVFHFDRWWNPAVEDQATDRAYRIGQTRTVQVHKFVVRGTLEERIDQMIEQKTELARNIIGEGERWLTELSTEQLRDLLTLRNDAVDDEA